MQRERIGDRKLPFATLQAHESPKQTLTWSFASKDVPAQGTALVVHGLNMEPARMQPVIKHLSLLGIESLGIALHGHGANYNPLPTLSPTAARLHAFKRVTHTLWKQEIQMAYTVARLRSAQRGVPLFLVAYSMGALLTCNLMAAEEAVRFDRMVFFAPALKIHHWCHCLRLLSPFPHFVIPSFAPPKYRANRGTPMAAYNAIFQGAARLAHAPVEPLDVPALLFLDPDDELVSYPRVTRMVQERFHHWTIHRVIKHGSAQSHYHHLMANGEVVGAKSWNTMLEKLEAHLLARAAVP
jgi:pimeloyl-ACP methyl ester carboxylesterase